MNATQVYKFCPRCAAPLEVKSPNMLTCTECKNHIFINASATVGIVIENENGEILTTVRAHDPGKGFWDLPGGFIMPNETVEEAVVRETEEELRVRVTPGNIFKISPNIYPYQGIDVPLLDIFISASIISGTLTPSDDVASCEFVSKEKVLTMNHWSPSITNALKTYIENSAT